MKNLTLNQLAQKLNGKYWESGDKKRVYLNKGYNTKKMQTTTYVIQEESGSFKVCCYVDCPSQNYTWIKTQQEEVVKKVEDQIAVICSEYFFYFKGEDGTLYDEDFDVYKSVGDFDEYCLCVSETAANRMAEKKNVEVIKISAEDLFLAQSLVENEN